MSFVHKFINECILYNVKLYFICVQFCVYALSFCIYIYFLYMQNIQNVHVYGTYLFYRQTEIARNFAPRLEYPIELQLAKNLTWIREMLVQISSGCCALLLERQISQYFINKVGKDLGNIHISKEAFGPIPYYLGARADADPSILLDLNIVLVINQLLIIKICKIVNCKLFVF